MTKQSLAHDPDTLAFYDREAEAYAGRGRLRPSRHLDAFLAQLATGAKILELGCGGGQDSLAMIRAGFDVTPTDGSAGLAREAEKLLGRRVKVLRFEELDEQMAYDAVWANACLLHVPEDQLGGVLAKVHAALRPAGRFCASYKKGSGGGRDRLGRYFNFPSRATLEQTYVQAAAWASVTIDEAPGGGYDSVARTYLYVTAVKA